MRTCWLFACAGAILSAAAVGAQDTYPESIPTPDGAPRAKYERLEVAGRDGTKLVVHEWAPAKASAGKPAILFVHGIGFHGEPHASIQAGFTSRGMVFCAIDLRGHGRSGGNRGELAEPQVLRADLGAAMGLIAERHRDAPIVLCGESMGGLIAADYAWRGERRVAGLVLLVPAFAVHKSQIKLEGIAAALSGRVAIGTDAKLAASTRVEGFVTARKADKLALREVKVPYLTAIASMQLDWPRAAADLKLPLFIGVAGKDRIVDSRAARAVYDSAGTPSETRTWRQWDDACHTLCWDPLTPQIVGEVASWALGLVEKAPAK